jgi:predicted solute-binding protein
VDKRRRLARSKQSASAYDLLATVSALFGQTSVRANSTTFQSRMIRQHVLFVLAIGRAAAKNVLHRSLIDARIC